MFNFRLQTPPDQVGRYPNLWAIAEKLHEMGLHEVESYDRESHRIKMAGWTPMRLERRGGRPLSVSQVEDLQDKLISLSEPW